MNYVSTHPHQQPVEVTNDPPSSTLNNNVQARRQRVAYRISQSLNHLIFEIANGVHDYVDPESTLRLIIENRPVNQVSHRLVPVSWIPLVQPGVAQPGLQMPGNTAATGPQPSQAPTGPRSRAVPQPATKPQPSEVAKGSGVVHTPAEKEAARGLLALYQQAELDRVKVPGTTPSQSRSAAPSPESELRRRST